MFRLLNMKENSKNRPFSAARQFYPEDKKSLSKKIKELIRESDQTKIDGKIFGLLLPHATYQLSGRITAQAVKNIQGKKFDTVIILSDSHYEYFNGISLWSEGKWETPLGKIEVDKKMAEKFLDSFKDLISKQSPFIFDHTVEVQLPFLQMVLGKFKLLPLSFGSEKENWKELAKTILNNIKDKKVLIIASSDLSHYLPYKKANEIDKEILKTIANLDTNLLEKKITNLENENIPGLETFLCSQDSVKVLMEITKSVKGKAEVLNYANSGDFTDDKLKVVGYGTVIFYK